MDQESFRKLLEVPRPGNSNNNNGAVTSSRGSLLASKKKTTDTSQPSFKPRKVTKKQSEQKYRDRAAERRVGEGNDFAQVEALLEDFERQTAHNDDKTAVDEQRRYLGGDGDHSILVKGLDLALLEQNKARAALSTEDDESLEKAFHEVSKETTFPKKKTRQDLIQELKGKRQSGVVAADVEKLSKTAEEEGQLLEEAKKAGKFKPIGSKPVSELADEKGKRKKEPTKAKDDRKKKKRKVDERGESDSRKSTNGNGRKETPLPLPLKMIPPPPATATAEAEPVKNDDFDIFADAGEYEGIDLGDDDEDEETPKDGRLPTGQEVPSVTVTGRWFATEDSESGPPQSSLLSKSPPPEVTQNTGEEEEQLDQPIRLVPLASSALPSIKDFLAMDKAAGDHSKRRKRKDKKGGGGEATAKVDRDYKRLKSYTEKKATASTSK